MVHLIEALSATHTHDTCHIFTLASMKLHAHMDHMHAVSVVHRSYKVKRLVLYTMPAQGASPAAIYSQGPVCEQVLLLRAAMSDGSMPAPEPESSPRTPDGLTRVHGIVSMCPMGNVCGRGCRRLGWHRDRAEAEEKVVNHLLDGNVYHGDEELTIERCTDLASQDSNFYEESRLFDETGTVVHHPSSWKGGGKGKGGDGGGGGKGKGGKGGKGKKGRSRSRDRRRSRSRRRRSRSRRRDRSRTPSPRGSAPAAGPVAAGPVQTMVAAGAMVRAPPAAAGRAMNEMMQGPPPPNLGAPVEATWWCTYMPTYLYTHVGVCFFFPAFFWRSKWKPFLKTDR